MQWIVLFGCLFFLSIFVICVALLICQVMFGRLPWEDSE